MCVEYLWKNTQDIGNSNYGWEGELIGWGTGVKKRNSLFMVYPLVVVILYHVHVLPVQKIMKYFNEIMCVAT